MRGWSAFLVGLVLLGACGRTDPTPTAAVRTYEPSTPPSPLASPATTAAVSPTTQPRAMAEGQAWAEVRLSLPGVPIVLPTWLPPSLDRSRVQLRQLVIDPAAPRYVVAYVAPDGPELSIALGPTPDARSGDSAIGTRVRNSGATLIYVGGWPATSGAVVTRKVRWVEGNYVLRIESERFSGDDLLHVAWSLDRTGAPAPTNPYTRVKPGICAAQGAAPDETVRRLLGFVGAGDRDAVRDCFSLELLGEFPVYGAWADLPRASDLKLSPPSAIAGRFVVGVSWRFASDPGGAWSQQAHHFFTLGQEDGSWRIYETATAAIGPPP